MKIWLCIFLVLFLCNVLIYRLPVETEYNYPCTSVFSTMLIEEGMEVGTVTTLLGGPGFSWPYGDCWYYTTLGGGLYRIYFTSDSVGIFHVDHWIQEGQIGEYVFWAVLAAATVAETIVFLIKRKKTPAQ